MFLQDPESQWSESRGRKEDGQDRGDHSGFVEGRWWGWRVVVSGCGWEGVERSGKSRRGGVGGGVVRIYRHSVQLLRCNGGVQMLLLPYV